METRTRLFLQNLAAILPHVETLPNRDKELIDSLFPIAQTDGAEHVFNRIAAIADDCRKMKGHAAPHPATTDGKKVSECKSCGASIYWIKTFKGKNIPVDAATYNGEEMFDRNTHQTHFETCPHADEHRSARASTSSVEPDRTKSPPSRTDKRELPF